MRIRFQFWLVLLLILPLSRTLAADTAPDAAASGKNTAQPAGKNTVFWISVDGFRGDYVDRGQTPFLASLMEHGAYTRQMTPIFPSLTFPSHVAEATGVAAGQHGIVSNRWFDMSVGKEFNMPGDPNLLQSEPIWITASRQGVRTAVLDWPLSQAEEQLPEGSVKAAYFNPTYDPMLSDLARVEKVVEVYRNDRAAHPTEQPLRLLMGYVHGVDSAGHTSGPDSPETNRAIHQVDETLKQVVGEVADIFKQQPHSANDNLYILITTDHGMDDVKTLVNVRKLIGAPDVPDSVRTETSGSLGNVYLYDVPGPDREKVKTTILDHLRQADFAKFWLREELPEKFAYGNPTRTGDIVVSLDSGYDFTNSGDAITTPANESPRALKGMHGYDPALDPKMQGFTILARWGSDQPGSEIGQFDSLRIHPTVAKVLGIKPAPAAKGEPISPLP
jgi:predicted AlkP superfamily pyrophosphatase or phosphodiesterase